MTDKTLADVLKTAVPTSDEFCQTLAHATWLMTISNAHKDKTVTWINAHVIAPLMFKQVRIYTKGKQPLAAVIWAYVSPEVKGKIEAGGYEMSLPDWRSGEEIVIFECISPMMDTKIFMDQFMSQIQEIKQKTS